MPDINPQSQDVTALQAMVQSLMDKCERLETEKISLVEQFKLALDRQFAKCAESFKPYDEAQGDLFNGVEQEATAPVQTEVVTTSDKKVRGKRKPLPKDLPRERIVLDLTEEEKVCACCHGELHKIGDDVSEKLEFIPAVLKVLEYVRPKYGCRQCEQNAQSVAIKQQPAPTALIPKSYATESLLANIILGKYQYALPLYR